MRDFIQRYGPLIPLAMIVFGLIAGIVYLVGTIAVRQDGLDQLEVDIPTVIPPLPGAPVDRYFQVAPAIVDRLDYDTSAYTNPQPDALGIQVQSIGAYLPRTGNTRFSLLQPTPMPTPLPYPTSPPLPLPYVPESTLPAVGEFSEDGTPRTIPYIPGEEDCAPAGYPVDGILTQRFHLYHSGIDIGVRLGSPVIATHSGQITYADWSDIGYGYLVIVQSGAFITYYAHNTSFNVTQGQFIGRGSIIAWSGSTGNSTGPHVHYETRINDVPVDPQTFESRGYATC